MEEAGPTVWGRAGNFGPAEAAGTEGVRTGQENKRQSGPAERSEREEPEKENPTAGRRVGRI